MAKSCNACGKFLSATGAASCSVCPSLYHKACVLLSEASPVSKGWVCPECMTKTRKEDNTPVRPVASNKLAPPRLAAPRSLSNASSPAASSSSAPTFDLQDVHHELGEWMAEIREFRQEMAQFRATMSGLSTRIDDIEQRLPIVEQRQEASHPEVAELQCRVALLQQELSDRDQDALLSDLEIGHLPEDRGESVVHAVTLLAAKLGVTLDERDIVFAERVGTAQGAGAGGGALQARRVVVRLARRSLRDQLLQAARVRRTLTAADVGREAAPPHIRIFINERLTRVNRQLFYRVREECRRLRWSVPKRGRIYVRQDDGKQAFPIRSEMDVKRVFRLESVCTAVL